MNRLALSILILIMPFLMPSNGVADAVTTYGLTFGPYGVGVRTDLYRDFSRGWLTLTGPIGYRPLLVRIWYPSNRHGRMPYADYFRAVKAPREVRRAVDEQIRYSIDSTKNALSDSNSFSILSRTRVPASLGAPPANGSFPVIVYGLGQNDQLAENTVLCEFLASHGYVVLTVAQFATNERRHVLFVDDAYSYETQVRDLETALNEIPAALRPDRNRLAFVGMSMGGDYTLLAAMHNPHVRALVGLDPSYVTKRASYELNWKTLPSYDPLSLTAPVLDLYRQEDEHVLDDVLAMTRSDRYLAEVPHAVHGDFTSFPWLTRHIPVTSLDKYAAARRNQGQAANILRFVDSTVLSFLNDKVREAGHFALSTTAIASVRHETALQAPAEEQLAATLMTRGYAAAETDLKTAMARYPGAEIVRFKTLNRIGLEFLYSNRAALSVDSFRLNVIAHPHSADAYESLGEGYAALSDRVNAEAAFKQALAIDPGNGDARSGLAKLVRP